ncbi:MAG TPA: thiamine pyrophosphate-dependent dehydrogenase E1 component subunit alpha [Firmicutes bacterium]|uniref:thiamine pyrophosphate-dependent dehydrogenase E1 component subunit alpha n=1 Tax=Gelria sp. Kuro-4 TaxID=2796927 RepID=UPI0019C29F32|nr:thiamine pyrophosphate-dependent dehydrogenase E1 component subunit alpha [Gelria sp. Kuro-4]BCV23513.1 pyruvate dehydrogenase E1 component subunit alpha [Gelria sp. Kuro-4]HHV58188.1 thiamine pyrophosphate-dependent dehydrogenase E1 component subunit alpha [Bacillota bacterium]
MEFSRDDLKAFYRTMFTIRSFEEKINDLFLAGEIPGFVHLYIGEEAIATGVMANLKNTDYITSTHRGHGHTIAKGADLKRMMAEIFGKRTGYCHGKGGSMHIADFSIGMLGANGVVGGGYNLAVGAALAAKLSGSDRVSVCFFGDGASNRGTFHEAMNMAAAWKLPAIFVCENNQWASTTPYRTTTSVENIADRAIGYSIPGVVVNGNDVFSVYEAAQAAVERARSGGGPTLIEAKTYRIKGHFVGDPEMYRTREEVQEHFENDDPLKNFREQVLTASRLSEKELAEIEAQVKEELAAAVQFAKESPYPGPEELFQDLYVESGEAACGK